MPDLPGSTPQKDLAMFKYVFSSPDLQPDQIKIYPCVVNEFAELYSWYKAKKYKPYTKKQLLDLLIAVKKIVPPYMRINRLIRDIPEESIVAGNKITNLRQFLQIELKKQGASCQCLRCREVRDDKYELKDLELVHR
jgi:histone acetyltransferase (RNA polymerase elongator complex component)